MKLIEKAKNLFKNILNQLDFQGESVTPLQWLMTLAVMIAIRTLIILGSEGLFDRPIFMVAIFYFQDLFFFLDSFLLTWIWLSLFLRVKPQELSRLMLWGTWLVILPPIIDLIGYKTIFWSFYLFNDIGGLWMQYYSIFGHLPPAIVYFGSKIGCILAVVVTSIFVYHQTRKTWKAIVNGWAVYSIFFFMGSFPSWLSYLYYSLAKGKSLFLVTIADVAGFVASPVELFGIKHVSIGWMTMIKLNFVYFLFSLGLFFVLIRLAEKGKIKSILAKFFATNLVWLHLGMFLFGFGLLGIGLYPQNFSPSFFAWCSFGVLLASIGANLMVDNLLLDQKTEPKAGAFSSQEQVILLNVIALGGFFVVGIKFFLLALVYRSLFVLYRKNQFGLEKIWLTEYFLKWIALLMSMFFGFMLMSQDQTLEQFPIKLGLWVALGLLAVFSLRSNEKMEEKGASPAIFDRTDKKMALEVFLFLIFVAGSFVMHKPDLFFWSILLGGISFWAIEKEYSRKKWLIRALFLFHLFLGLAIM